MSKRPSKKKIVVGTASAKGKNAPASVKSRSAATTATRALTFGRETYIWMGIGFGLVLIGMVLMMGGAMPDADTWDENIIYSFQRTVLAPMVILIGLVVEIYAIFKK